MNHKDLIGISILYIAAQNGLKDTVLALLQAGATVDAKNKDLWTPLHTAAYEEHLPVVQALMSAEADLNAKDSTLATPLHNAAFQAHVLVVQALVTRRRTSTPRPRTVSHRWRFPSNKAVARWRRCS